MITIQLTLIFIWMLKLNLALLKSCAEKHEELDICYMGNKGYSNPGMVQTFLVQFFFLLQSVIFSKTVASFA